MLNLPKNTELYKQLPKKAIYAKFGLKSAQQEKFDADISRIAIVNEVTPNTTAIVEGLDVSGFYVVSVILKSMQFDDRNIIMLSKLIPQNILFVLLYEEQVKLAVYHTKLLCSSWNKVDNTTIELTGLDFDAVWTNLVINIGNLTIEGDNSIKEQIEQDAEKSNTLKKVEKLEKLARAEKQPRRKFELVQELNRFKYKV